MSPARLSPLPPGPHDASYFDLESQPPVIHDIVTTSPSDNEPQGAMSFVTNMDLGAQLDVPVVEISTADSGEPCSASPMTEFTVSAEPALDTPADSGLIPASFAGEEDVSSAVPEVNVPTETLTATEPLPHVEADISFAPGSTEPESTIPQSLETERPAAPETLGSAETEEEEAEREEDKPSETMDMDEGEDEEGEKLSHFF